MTKKPIKTKPLISHGSVALNRRARYDYEILEEIEAGIVLTGSEVKSLRRGLVNLGDSYAGPSNGNLVITNLHIGEYQNAPKQFQHQPTRVRQLLVKRKERARLLGAITRERLTLIPIKLYFNQRGIAKLLLGLGKGKREIDKRQTIKERDWQRQKGRILAGE
ncbi:MAG: SsrA-binding protein SmpB [Alphaproteobacteria bacterium]